MEFRYAVVLSAYGATQWREFSAAAEFGAALPGWPGWRVHTSYRNDLGHAVYSIELRPGESWLRLVLDDNDNMAHSNLSQYLVSGTYYTVYRNPGPADAL